MDAPVWLFWNRGLENAPDIMKACYKSVKRHVDRNIVLLTDENLREYIHMPKCIERKKRKRDNAISNLH